MEREQQMMAAAEAYAESVGYKDENDLCATLNIFCGGWRAADQHPRWIPVEERLPEEGQVVFIYTKHGSVSSVAYKDGAFNLNEVLEAINVTHWMQITPPAKKGGEQ